MSAKPVFQKRHYELLARALRAASVGMTVDSDGVWLSRMQLANMLANDNPNFSLPKFLSACTCEYPPAGKPSALTATLTLLFDGKSRDEICAAVAAALPPR